MEATVLLPPKACEVFAPPRGSVDYRGMHGGRGSAKSRSAAKMAAIWGLAERLRILCVREYQSSIKESFHAELKAAIESEEWLAANYDVGVDYLRGHNGTEFIFKGVRRNLADIRSTAGIDLTVIEEAEDVPEHAWEQLEPTVLREPNSEIWAIWNPCLKGSPVDDRLRIHPPERAIVREMNYTDNPFFPESMERLRVRDQSRLDPGTYAHIWEGAYLENTASQILAGKVSVREFTPLDTWNGPYFGADWGFSQDPTAAVKCWVADDCLYVEHEAGRVDLELDDTAKYLIERIPGIANHVCRGDNARPETISHLKRKGLPHLVPVDKWPGSVEDGIAHLRSYSEIVVHPRCRETIKESRLYSYKVDRLTGDVLPVVVDAHNHYMDAIRYALQPMIKKRSAGFAGLKVAGL